MNDDYKKWGYSYGNQPYGEAYQPFKRTLTAIRKKELRKNRKKKK
jgi:hypothetical protein